ncbi:MAG: hypothetical protein LBD59_01920 [Prevotellaceae bacterium]|nr:hypothetical protein [Prevotellaceae bacterium]
MEKKIFLRWKENFPAVERKFSCGGKKIFLRWEKNFPAVGKKFSCGGKKIACS